MDRDREWTDELDTWLAPFLAVMGRKTRRSWAPLYLRGLLGPGDRKSLQPMAARLGLSSHDQLQHFIASPAWDDRALWTELAHQADRLVGGPDACLVIDDTALPKKVFAPAAMLGGCSRDIRCRDQSVIDALHRSLDQLYAEFRQVADVE